MPVNFRQSLRRIEVDGNPASSQEVDLGGKSLVGIGIPDNWSAADLTVEVSADGDVWRTPQAAELATLTATADSYIALSPADTAGWWHVRFGASAAQTNAILELHTLFIS